MQKTALQQQPTEVADNQEVYLLNLSSRDDLYTAYMPFIKGGGLFIRTDKDYALGDEIFIALQMPEVPGKLSILGSVVWVTPKCAQNSRAAGIGVQFIGENAVEIHKTIETMLVGSLNSERRTDTL